MTPTWKESLDDVNWEELSALYRAAPLGDKSPAWLRTAFSNCLFRCFAYDGEKLVGAGRVLADGVDCAYLCDVAILPSHQGHGIGREIISRLLARSKGHRKIILYSVPGKEAFYQKARLSAHDDRHGDFRRSKHRGKSRIRGANLALQVDRPQRAFDRQNLRNCHLRELFK